MPAATSTPCGQISCYQHSNTNLTNVCNVRSPRTDHTVCVPMNCTNINYMCIVAQYIAIVNYVKTIYRFHDGRRTLSTYKIGQKYGFSAKYRKKRPQICGRFDYVTVIIGFTVSSGRPAFLACSRSKVNLVISSMNCRSLEVALLQLMPNLRHICIWIS